jgi:hypothetical protein
MRRRDLVRALMTMSVVASRRPEIRPARALEATQALNAADVYRKAFEWSERLQAEQRERLRNAATIAIDDRQVRTMIQRARPALEAMREAAAIDACRWGTEPIAIDDLGKGHLNAANLNVIRVACLSARRHAKLGQGREALDDVFAGLTLAHRVGTGGFLFARVLECGGEIPAFQALARILPALDRVALDDLSRRLDVLPPPEPAAAAIGPESRFILSSLRAKLRALGAVVDGAEWAELGLDEEQAAALKRLTGGDRAKLLAHLESMPPAFAELARRLDLPRPGCHAALDEFAKAERSTHPIAAGLVKNAFGVRHAVDRMHALRSIAHAGIVLVRDGEPAFRAVSDPFGTGAFGLERRGSGYLIRSALNDGGRPDVSLEIGDAG